ncbi:MAG TPA: DUF4386 domain-containing protein [Thermoanaerobaculia bacterium]|nr:DUF4386 domain-containing protein [Thermoanaerobaculia bacterium]
MEATSRPGRIVGALILAQMVGSVLVNFVLTAPLFGTPGFLVSAAAHPRRIGISVLLGLAIGAISLAIAITAFPVFRPRSQAMTLWFFALGVVSLALAVVEQMNVMSMLSLSQAYAKTGVADRESFQALRGVVAASRNWAHFVGLIVGGCTHFVLYAVLYRFALIPRALAAFGLVAVLLQITAVSMPLFGHDVVFPLLAPMGVSQLALALWLLTKGFRDVPGER